MQQSNSKRRRLSRFTTARVPLAAAIHLACVSLVFADTDAQDQQPAEPPSAATTDTGSAPALSTVTVTAQKRTENLQDVPISIDVLSTEKLREMNVANFADYVKLLPSVSYQALQPGFNQVYMRGVASGGDGNHSGPLPSVGIYLDEEPITTIQGALDVHIYDIERVEALSGPQGTLYGASSESGTIRIITNKPDPKAFAAGFSTEANAIDGGGLGYVTEGYANIPLSDNAAIRLVGWSKQDAGYIDNVYGTRTFPSSGITIDNANRARDDYNFADTRGARAALKIDLNDSWSITPTVMGQSQFVNGFFAFDPKVGDLKVTRFYPEKSEDRWVQAALTVQGKIGNFDLVYAYAHLNRDVDSQSDYNDYGFWYDTLLGYGTYFQDDNGNLINPSQYIQAVDGYTKDSHELRISSPREDRLRFVTGVFWQDQKHDIQQRYKVDNLAESLSVTGWPDTIWLTKQLRRDHDEALFGEVSYDLTDKLTATGGVRFFRADNSLKGFFGFGTGYSGSTGEAACFSPLPFEGAPCLNLDKEVKETGSLGRFNLTYKLDEEKMIYATWSEGFRPGGINRRGSLPPYLSDYLTNYELGWKTLWADHRLMFNGAVFLEKWKDFQFALLGQNGLTEIKNANQAEIRGIETSLNWAATYNLNISGGLAYYHSELTANYCGFTDEAGNPETHCDNPEAPKGTELPITAKVKGNLTGRYSFDVGAHPAYVQGSVIHEGKRRSDLRLVENEILGNLPAYTSVDLSAGIQNGPWSLDFYLKNAFDKRGELVHFTVCAETVCGGQVYTIPIQPRTVGLRLSREF